MSKLELATRHVIEAQARVDLQRQILARLRRARYRTAEAECLLAVMEGTLRCMMQHAEILKAEADSELGGERGK
jgi:hypothetical protein